MKPTLQAAFANVDTFRRNFVLLVVFLFEIDNIYKIFSAAPFAAKNKALFSLDF